jgi:hypothetical protein
MWDAKAISGDGKPPQGKERGELARDGKQPTRRLKPDDICSVHTKVSSTWTQDIIIVGKNQIEAPKNATLAVSLAHLLISWVT